MQERRQTKPGGHPGSLTVCSGGQTGVDRAALDAALEAGVPVTGWCPRGRRAEDGTVPLTYALCETPSRDYAQRTAWNVRDSDATLVLVYGAAGGGTALTIEEARRRDKPVRVLHLADPDVEAASAWLRALSPRVLNVAGPRESEVPGVYAAARPVVARLLRVLVTARP